ncbi:MAG: hypothetical protein ACFFEV_10295 [Candidatus Thorarchaeota archaeon]
MALFVIIPFENWIPFFVIIFLIILVSTFVVGFVNKGVAESIWEISLPNNRKWLITQGFLVYILGAIIQICVFSVKIWVESSLESWSDQLPGSLGDFLVGMITEPLSLVGILLTGIIGYLIAIKIPMFKDS